MSKLERRELYFGDDQSREGCVFCGQFETGSRISQEFSQTYPSLKEKGQVIDASDNFVLIPDIAPITKDHLLLVPKNHFPSFSSVPQSLGRESTHLIFDIISRMEEFYPHSEIIAFEHGVGKINGQTIQCGGCGRTDHAHLHILPISYNEGNSVGIRITEIISQNFKLVVKKTLSLPDLNINVLTGKLPYLYLWSNRMNFSLVFIQEFMEGSIPSQLIRRLLATEISGVREEEQDRWDWRDYIIFHSKQGEQMISDTLSRWIPKVI